MNFVEGINMTWRGLSSLLRTMRLLLCREMEMIPKMVWRPLVIDFPPGFMTRRRSCFGIVGAIPFMWLMRMQLKTTKKAGGVIHKRLPDQHLTNCLFCIGSNITSVFIHVPHYNNNWVISLWLQCSTVESFRLLPKWIGYQDLGRLTH